MSAGTLALRGVAYDYPDGRRALDGVDLDVAAGERVAVLGPNGAGKTTLVLHCNGILRPTAGEVRACGIPTVGGDLREIRRRVGVVFQDPDDQLFMATVGQDVAFGPANLGYRGSELDERVAGALDAVGLGDAAGRAPHHLSFGERRRAAIATVLAMAPEVLVLDEPSSNLDPAARREVADVLRRSALTTLVVTHDLPYALEVCERAVVLDAGRVVADGPTADVLSDAPLLAAHRLELPPGFDPRALRRGESGWTATRAGNTGHVDTPKGHGGPKSITLQPGRHAGAAARRFVYYAADQWLGTTRLGDVLTVVNEFVCNAATHAGTPMVLNLDAVDGHVRVELYDGSPEAPVRVDGATSENGLGLRIVDGVALRWGVELRRDGKVVWAEI